MNLVLLGAGASKAYVQSPTRLQMPVTRDFFRTFQQMKGADHPWIITEGLITFIKDELGLTPDEFLNSNYDIEELHSQIEDSVQRAVEMGDELARINSFRAYNELTFLFAFVVNSIQNGPVSIAHRKLARQLSANDAVLTFNWDTLMDRALATECDWIIDSGYHIMPQAIYTDEWRTPTEYNLGKYPVITKLHGSTNWLTSYTVQEQGKITLTQASSPETVYFFESSTRPYDTYAGRHMPGYEPYSYGYYPPNILDDPGKPLEKDHVLVRTRFKNPWRPEGSAGDKGLISMPLIIPPVKNKHYELFGNLFKQLWECAESYLVQAEKIVIIGYSFPHTDHRSNQLFIDAFLKRSTFPKITIINPSPGQLHDKFRNEFGIPDEYITVFEDYFSAEFPLQEVFAD